METMSVDKDHSSTTTISPPLSAAPFKSQSPPPPLSIQPLSATDTVSYQDVVSDENLFMATLEALHKSLGTKFLVPRVGGRPLNLHRLFVEVTSRGGIEKVIRDRVWKDVISSFNFPSTITNASFVLRKYYISLLQHYEEVHFFNNKDLMNLKTAASLSKSNQVETTGPHGNAVRLLTDSSFGEVVIDQEPLKPQDPTQSAELKRLPGYPPLEIGSCLRGEITGKFENGYLVTAIYGSEKLTGVLYHSPFHPSQNQTLSSSSSGQRRRKRPLVVMEDTSVSMPNSSNVCVDHGAKVNASLPTEDDKISKQLGDLWNRLTQPSSEENQETDSEGALI